MASRQTDNPLWARSVCHYGGTLSVCVCIAGQGVLVSVIVYECVYI